MPQRSPTELATFGLQQLSSEQLSSLLGSTRELLALLTSDGCVIYASEGFGRVLGYFNSELVGTPLVNLLHPDQRAAAQQCIDKLAATPGGWISNNYRIQRKDGAWRWFEVSSQNHLRYPGVEAIVVSFLDITDLRRMQEERQTISDIIHALNETSNLDQLLLSIHQSLKKVLYAENCFVVLHNRETDNFHFAFFTDELDQQPAPQKLPRTCTSLVFRTGRAMLIPQSEFDRLAQSGEVELVGSPSPAWLGVPLKTPTATIGVLVVQHYQNEKAYDERDLEFLDSVGGHIALAIERRSAEDALRNSASMFRLFFSNNPLPTWVFDCDSLLCLQVNDAAVKLFGYSMTEFEAMTILDLRPATEHAAFLEFLRQPNSTQQAKTSWKHVRKDGRIIDAEVIAHRLEYAGRPVYLVVAQDVGERQLLEDQLRQAQKMEAVGRLAGGVAHDFNNLLMVIKGHTELLLNMLPQGNSATRKVELIDRAADRAASLTRQLLAFSRMQVLQPRVINLNKIVEDMGKLIPRLLGEDVDLVVRTSPDLGAIRADASQMEQVIMNLAVNARDAMPDGGRLVIETSNTELDRSYANARPVVTPGPYILLAVSDTGTGMDQETQARIFEPFFTTKEQGKGTGLGLSTVYGVVKQSGGFIWVYSELGKGTSFKIYLPRVDQPIEAAGATASYAEAPRGTETVLLAEDEADVRELAREFLAAAGYTVIEARNGQEALKLAAERGEEIDLLVSDLVMPGMAGQQLAALLQQQDPSLRVIFMSGYSEHAAAEAAQAGSSVRILTKPFNRTALLRTIREVLDASSASV
jgi:two-component system, cell cycle sensor histidine kinase and response regulator CckA